MSDHPKDDDITARLIAAFERYRVAERRAAERAAGVKAAGEVPREDRDGPSLDSPYLRLWRDIDYRYDFRDPHDREDGPIANADHQPPTGEEE